MREVTADESSLVGQFVLTPKGPGSGPRGHQGQIVQEPGTKVLVQWFSWSDGEPTNAQLYSSDQVMEWGWSFYSDHADWIHAGREMTYDRKYPRNPEGEEQLCVDHGPFPGGNCHECMGER